MTALLDLKKTIHGWDVIAWKVGAKRWVKRAGNGVSDAYIAETFRPGFSLWGDGVLALVPVTRVGYWREGVPLSASDHVRLKVAYPLAHRLGDTGTCQGEWNDRTHTQTGCERPAAGRFLVANGLSKKKLRLCAECAAKR